VAERDKRLKQRDYLLCYIIDGTSHCYHSFPRRFQLSQNKSTYYFIGKHSEYAAKYQVQQEPLGNGFHFEVYLDGIAIWGSSDKPILELIPEIRETFDTIVAAYVFKTQRQLSYRVENWVEATNVVAPQNTIGWVLSRVDSAPLSRRSPSNTPWRRAALLYRLLAQGRGNINHRLALKDYYSAVMNRGDDAFVFAYRAVEDICRAVTGSPNIEGKDWQTMHRAIGTNKSMIDPLTRVSEHVRHGDILDSQVVQARSAKNQLINIAHQVISLELKRSFPKF
jgi:hypothetical protein